MQIKLTGKLTNVEEYQGKNGYGANITVSQKVGRKTTNITFRTDSKNVVDSITEFLDMSVSVEIELEQNAFGLRFGRIIEFVLEEEQEEQEKKVS